MKIDTTPIGQISPMQSVEIRTQTLRTCLRDLRENGFEIATAMGATGTREITLDNGELLRLTQIGCGENAWHPQTCQAIRFDSRECEIIGRYPIYPL